MKTRTKVTVAHYRGIGSPWTVMVATPGALPICVAIRNRRADAETVAKLLRAALRAGKDRS